MNLNPKTPKNFIAAILWVFNTPIALSYYRSFEEGLTLGLILAALIFVVLQLISDQPFYDAWFETILALGIAFTVTVPIFIWIFS